MVSLPKLELGAKTVVLLPDLSFKGLNYIDWEAKP